MLSLFKKLFGKSEPKAVVPVVAAPAAPVAPMPTIEVAHLSLAAIVARFPDELKSLLTKEADPAATVAFPLPNILKQLPVGCVKMSLATLQRQAHGLIKPLPPGDKRTVEVPLAEVFRHVRLDALQRRSDQRPVAVPEIGYNLFSDGSNPYAIAPDDHLEQTQVVDLSPEAEEPTQPVRPATAPTAQRVIQPPADLVAPKRAAAAPVVKAATAAPAVKVAAAAAPLAKPVGATQALPIAPLAAAWPEDIRAEVAALAPDTKVNLPVDEVMAGLAKGRVSFSWAQIHAWLEPQAPPIRAAADIALQLPLKLVAPAFLAAAAKPAAERKSLSVDENIPSLFSGNQAPAEEPAETSAPSSADQPPVAEQPTEPQPIEAAAPAEVASDPHKQPETVGEIFGQPHKHEWTPSELVAGIVTLPGAAGAVVALQEGLQVAASLPDGIKSEVVAAFLPQIFARLNQYSGEMKLGEVDDLLFTTNGAHCQIYRLGYVYLAILGKPGESLPWHELRLIAEELARQTHK